MFIAIPLAPGCHFLVQIFWPLGSCWAIPPEAAFLGCWKVAQGNLRYFSNISAELEKTFLSKSPSRKEFWWCLSNTNPADLTLPIAYSSMISWVIYQRLVSSKHFSFRPPVDVGAAARAHVAFHARLWNLSCPHAMGWMVGSQKSVPKVAEDVKIVRFFPKKGG